MQKIRNIVIFFVLCLLVSQALGQKPIIRRQAKEPTHVVPTLEDFGFVVKLHADGSAMVAIQVSETSNRIKAQDLSRIYNYFSLLQVSKNKAPKIPFDPVIVIEAAPTLAFGKIWEFIEPLRRSGENRIKIVIGKSDSLIVPAKSAPSNMNDVKPNPLLLLVQLESSGSIKINNEPFGSLVDLQRVSNKLKEIFAARQQNGVFREMTNEVETTVRIKVASARSFEDVKKLAAEIIKAGSDRIFLNVDDKEDFMVERSELIPIH